jgi:peptidoglycan-N-acetylglucosamine deacetylase
MRNYKVLLLFSWILILTHGSVVAQYESNKENDKKFPWPNGAGAAVSLTFDDARRSQIDKGVPILNKYGVKATFYVTPQYVKERLDGWKSAIAAGHEIGNHTMTHPCTGNYDFSRNNALENYTLEKIEQNIERANVFLIDQLQITPKSFAYPCGQKFIGRGEGVKSYVPIVAQRFQTGRGWPGRHLNNPWMCDFSQLLVVESDGKSFEQLKQFVDQAIEEGRWLIFAGHNIDDPGAQTTGLSSLDELCRYISDPKNGVWVDTVERVATFIEKRR